MKNVQVVSSGHQAVRIAGSVLNYFAQTLMFAGSVFGLKLYVDHRLPK